VPSIDRDTFLSHLAASGLLEPAQFEAALADLPDSPRGRSVARRLVRRGVLTRFQAELLLAGRTDGFVLGQYRILEEIGRGGMGRVFKAEHLSMRRVVALKVLAAHLTRTERARQLFQREVRAAARLVHPNIVTAFDANSVGDRHFLVLEFVDGPNLSALVKEQGPLPVGQACDFVRQAALGLQHAHELGMVHRDVKPSNLLVQPPVGKTLAAGGVVKILDFGLARLCAPGPEGEAEEDTAFGGNQVVMGTPDYLSPEQGRSLHDVDIRADLYSLGCTLYYLLTAQVPFPGGTSLEKLVRHATVYPEPAESLRPVVPPGVSVILQRLLAKDAAERPQTPADLAAALEPFAEIAPVTWRGTRAFGSGTLTSSSAELGGSSELPGRGSPSSADVSLSGTQGMDGQSTKLSQAELQLIRSRSRFWRLWLRPLLFLLAVALGFALGVSLILMVR
jgi:serine/threonine protein kinase